MKQDIDKKSFQALIDMAPTTLHLKELALTSVNYNSPQNFKYLDGFPQLTSLTINTISNRFENILPLVRQLENLTIIGYRAALLEDTLLTSLKRLTSLTKLVMVLMNGAALDSRSSRFLLSEMISKILVHHTKLKHIDIYCGSGARKWLSGCIKLRISMASFF